MSLYTERRGKDLLTKQERASLRDPSLWEVEQVTACQFIAHHSTGEEFCLIAFRDGSFSITSNTGHLWSVDHVGGCSCPDAEFNQPFTCQICKHQAVAIAVERWQERQERAAARRFCEHAQPLDSGCGLCREAREERERERDTTNAAREELAAREASREQTRREMAELATW